MILYTCDDGADPVDIAATSPRAAARICAAMSEWADDVVTVYVRIAGTDDYMCPIHPSQAIRIAVAS